MGNRRETDEKPMEETEMRHEQHSAPGSGQRPVWVNVGTADEKEVDSGRLWANWCAGLPGRGRVPS